MCVVFFAFGPVDSFVSAQRVAEHITHVQACARARRKGHRERDGEATLGLLGNRMNGDYLPWNITSKVTCKFGQVGGLVIRRSLFFFFFFL